MRIYGLMPWQTGDLTDDEWTEILTVDNARIDAEKARARQQKRPQRQRRR